MTNSPSFSRRRLLGLALGVSGLAALGCGESCKSCQGPRPKAPAVTIYIVRHAEKLAMDEGGDAMMKKDPPLSTEGQARAMGLVEDLPVRDLAAVYVTRTVRSYDTASAVLALTGLSATYYPAKDYEGIVTRLSQRYGQSLLLVGHSNTIPPLLEAFGVRETVEIADDQYGDLWIVTLSDGEATLETRRYGEELERFDPGR